MALLVVFQRAWVRRTERTFLALQGLLTGVLAHMNLQNDSNEFLA